MEYLKHVEYIFLAIIVGGVGLTVKQIMNMSHNIAQMTVVLQVLSERLLGIDRMAQDHELRIRSIEGSERKHR